MTEFRTSGPIQLRLHLPAGAAEVTAADVTAASVELRPQDDSDDQAWAVVQRSRVELDSGVLVVHVPDQHEAARTPAMRLAIQVPLDSRVAADLASADLRCTGRLAQLKVKSASGDVTVEEVTGDVSVGTASGGVRVEHTQSTLSIKTASGAVDVVRGDGDVEVSVASGDIVVHDAGGSVRARSASGDVDVRAAGSGSLNVTTASGDVRVGVRAGTGVWLDLASGSGRTSSELLVEADSPAPDCALNIKVRTGSGDIQVRRAS